MTSTYIWRKPFLNLTYRFYSGGKQIGKMQENTWKRSASTVWNSTDLHFQTSGIFNQKTKVNAAATGEELAHITYDTLRNKANILLKDEAYQLENLNWNHSKWQISRGQKVMIVYHGSSFHGDIESDTEDPLLILSGMYVASYFWQNFAVAMVMVLFIILFAAK